MKKVFLWASVILVCYFASYVAEGPSCALLGASVPAAVHTISR